MAYLQTFLVFILYSWLGSASAAALMVVVDAPEWDTLPLVYRGDAQAFYEAINPLLATPAIANNPYTKYIQISVFHRVFNMYNDSWGGYLLPAFNGIASSESLEGPRNYLLAGVEQIHPPVNLEEAFIPADHRSPFLAVFDGAINHLVGEQNIFAYFVHGLMKYEEGIVEPNPSAQERGLYFLQRAADGFCLPALDILEAIYTRENESSRRLSVCCRSSTNKKLELIQKKKRQVSMLGNQDHLVPRVAIAYAIRESIFCEELTPPGNPISFMAIHPEEDNSHTTDYTLKFVGNILCLPRFDQPFYRDVKDHLITKMVDTIRGSRLGVTNRLWQGANLVAPLFTTTLIGFQAYYTSQPKPDTCSITQAYTDTSTNQTLKSTALVGSNTQGVAGISSLVPYAVMVTTGITTISAWSYNMYLYFRTTPLFVRMSEAARTREASLSALLCAKNHRPDETAKATADSIFTVWFDQTSRRCSSSCSTQPTLSQLVLKRNPL